MRHTETKTMDDVQNIAKIAIENELSFSWLEEQRRTLASSSKIEIHKGMTPTEMYSEIHNKLKRRGVDVNEKFFNELQFFVRTETE
jgi:hypothetical protein